MSLIPLNVLFAKPERAQLRISPLETWLGWTARDSNGVLNLWIQCLKPIKEIPEQITFSKDRDACVLFRFTMDDRTVLYLSDPDHGSELYHLYAIDLADPKRTPRDLISDPKMTAAIGFVGNTQLWLPPSTPRDIFVATGSGSLFWDISQINIDTSVRKLVAVNPMSTRRGKLWFALASLWAIAIKKLTCGRIVPNPPRAPVNWFPDRRYTFRGRVEASLADLCLHFSALQPNGAWKPLQSIPFDELNMQIVGSSGGAGLMRMDFNDDGRTVDLHTCVGNDTTSLVRLDAATGEELEVIANAKQSDISGFLVNQSTGIVDAALFEHKYERWQAITNDARMVEDLAWLQDRCKGSFSIMGRTLLDTTWVVLTLGDDEAAAYHLFNRETRSLTEIFQTRPNLASYRLGKMHPVEIETRDGENVLCYLSLPPDEALESARSLPLVLFIHGGPNARDSWGFHSACQLLSSRGMAVMQVNYRGSTGFGTRWVRLGMSGAFAKEMQYDVEDAARWAMRKGIADPDRMAILGASFGGYSALWHMTLGSLKLRAGVAICAVSTAGKAGGLGFRGDPLAARYWSRVFGRAALDLEVAKAASPLFQVCRIQAPLLLLHGESDPRVPLAQSDRMAVAARESGVHVEYVSYAKEGHGIRKEPNRLDMWGRIQSFLCRELGLPVSESHTVTGSTASLRKTQISVSKASKVVPASKM